MKTQAELNRIADKIVEQAGNHAGPLSVKATERIIFDATKDLTQEEHQELLRIQLRRLEEDGERIARLGVGGFVLFQEAMDSLGGTADD
jgi:hypothetical protein